MMKKLSIILASALLAYLLSACGDTQPSDVKDASESEESNRTDILYAYFGAEDVREYPIEYTGDQKTAEELAHELPRRQFR